MKAFSINPPISLYQNPKNRGGNCDHLLPNARNLFPLSVTFSKRAICKILNNNYFNVNRIFESQKDRGVEMRTEGHIVLLILLAETVLAGKANTAMRLLFFLLMGYYFLSPYFSNLTISSQRFYVR